MRLELIVNVDAGSDESLAQLAAIFAGIGSLLQSQRVVAQRQTVSETPAGWHVCAVADVTALPAPAQPVTTPPATANGQHEPRRRL